MEVATLAELTSRGFCCNWVVRGRAQVGLREGLGD
jgi:hypothetical protein